MKKTINVLVIEDNEYYNNLLCNSLQQSISSFLLKEDFRLVLRSFTNVSEYIRKVESNELDCTGSIVFLDYYLGNDITAPDIVKLLKERGFDTTIVLLSQSKTIKEKNNLSQYDYFVVKDRLAPAFCSLYLKQFIENKFSVTLG